MLINYEIVSSYILDTSTAGGARDEGELTHALRRGRHVA